MPVSEARRDESFAAEPPINPDPRELIRLEQEVRSLRYRLEVKDEAFKVLNERLMTWELELARRVAEARKEMAQVLGPAWWLVTAMSRARRVVLPDGTRRGRWWKAFYDRVVARLR